MAKTGKFKDYSTHMPMVIKVVQMTTGPVMEMGAGIFSTPLLHWLCQGEGRLLLSYEDTEEYYQIARKFRSKNHIVRFVEDWDKVEVDRHWDVILIDHTTHRRKIDAIRFKDNATYIILHDSEAPEHYGYNEVWSHFKYIYHWKNCQPWTTVVSNFNNLENL